LLAIARKSAVPRGFEGWGDGVARPVGRKSPRDASVAVEAEEQPAGRLAGAGADGQSVGVDDLPTQCVIVKDRMRGPGNLGQISHQLGADEGRGVGGTGQWNDSERQDVEPALATAQRIPPRDQAQWSGPRPPIELAALRRDGLRRRECHPGL